MALLGIVVGYWEFRDDLDSWLPAFGAVDKGYGIVQIALLATLSVAIFGTVVCLGYRALDWIFD